MNAAAAGRRRLPWWAAAVAALAGTGIVPSGAADDPGGAGAPVALSSFTVDADSFALGHVVRVGQAVAVPVELYAPHTRAHIDRSPRAQAYAGLGDAPIAELGPALGAPVEPPTFCYANFPGEGETSCGVAPGEADGGPEGFSSGTGGGHVSAGGDFGNPDATRADATVAVSDQRSPVVTLAHGRSTSGAAVLDGVPTGVTESVAGGIVVAGVLQVDQVSSSARAVAGGAPGTGAAEGSTRVVGIEVAGRPLALTERGLEVDGQVVAPDAAVGPARELAVVLAGAGVTVLPLEPPVRQVAGDGTAASVAVEGMVVRVALPDGNFEEVRLGGARVAVGAVPRPVEAPLPPDLPATPGVATPSDEPAGGPAPSGAGGTPSDPGAPPGAGTGPWPAPPAPSPAVAPSGGGPAGGPAFPADPWELSSPVAAPGGPLPAADATEGAAPSIPAASRRVAGRLRSLYAAAVLAFAAVCAAAALSGRGGVWTAVPGITRGSQP